MNNEAGTVIYDAKFDTASLKREFSAADKEADAQTKKIGDTIDKNIKEATDRTSERFENFRNVTVTALKATSVALGVVTAASAKMAGDFEQSLNVLASVTEATSDQMSTLSSKARELGQDVSLPGISAADAAGAMTELAKAGLSVNDVLTASKGVLSLAKAGNIEVSQAALVAAQALNAFKLSGTDATRVADILSAGSNASASSVEDMAYALQQSAAVASQFGVSLDDAVTAIALFANRGISGSDAGTSLKTMLIALAKPSGEAAELMEKLSINAFDAQGQFVGLRQLAINLQEGLKGLTQEQQNAALATIFGTDAFRAAAFLADSAGESYDSMSSAVNRSGAAADLAAAQNSGFNGALDNLKSTLETLGTDIGTKLLPPLTDFLKIIADELPPKIDWMIDHGGMLAGTIGGIGAAIGALRLAGFVNDLSQANRSLNLFVGDKNANGLRSISKLFGLTSSNASGAAKGITGLATAAVPAAASFGLAGLAIGGIAVGAGILIDKFIENKKATLGFSDSIEKSNKSLTPFSDSMSEIANTSVIVSENLEGTAKSIDLVTLATRSQEKAENDLKLAEEKYQRIQDKTVAINDKYSSAQNKVTENQKLYNEAVKQYGINSPETTKAAWNLQTAQINLEIAMRNTLGQTLNLQSAQGELKGATDALTASTDNLKNIQNFYNEAIGGTTGKMVEVGNAATFAIDKVSILTDTIGKTVEVSGKSLGQLKQNFVEVGDVIQASNRSLIELQDTLKSTQVQQTSGKIQGFGGGSVTIQGTRADGGPVYAGSSYLVGENGPEIYSPNTSGSILSNDILRGITAATMGSINGGRSGAPTDSSRMNKIGITNNNYITNGVTVDQISRAQARELRRIT